MDETAACRFDHDQSPTRRITQPTPPRWHGTGAQETNYLRARQEHRGIEIVWAPATSFFNIVERQHSGLGVPRAGYVEWSLEGRSISHRLVEPPVMIAHDVGAWNAAHGSTTKMPPRPLVRPTG
jgi:hypothetical protein